MTDAQVPGYPGGMIRVNQPFVNPETGQLSQPAVRFLDMIFKRCGGAGDFIFDNQTIVLDNEAAIGDISAAQEQLTADIQEIAGLFIGRDIEEIKDRIDILSALLESSNASTLANDIEGIKAKLQELDETTSNFGALFSELDSVAIKDLVLAKNIRVSEIGESGVGTKADTLWYTAGGTPTKKTSDYGSITFKTENFKVKEGALIKLEWSYTQDVVLNMFEWFMWQETVTLRKLTGTLIETILLSNEFMPATVNTNGIPGAYNGANNLGPTETKVKFIVVPALTGLWPADGLIHLQCVLSPHSGLSSPTDECFSGATFDSGASSIASAFKVINMSISGEAINAGPVKISS